MILTAYGPILALTTENKYHPNWEGPKSPSISNNVDILCLLRSEQNIDLPKHEGWLIWSLLLTENYICQTMLMSNRRPQLFILKSLISNVQVFFTTVVLSDATKSHNHNDFSIRGLRIVSLMEEKGDINYHQVKITTINVYFRRIKFVWISEAIRTPLYQVLKKEK